MARSVGAWRGSATTCELATACIFWDIAATCYAADHLVEVEVRAAGWEVLYRCPQTGARWLEDHPRSEEHGGGPIRLRRHDGWPPDAPRPHGQRVRERSSGRVGTIAGHSQSQAGDWNWAVHMHDDQRVWMVSHDDLDSWP